MDLGFKSHNMSKKHIRGPPLASPRWAQDPTKNPLKSVPEAFQKMIIFVDWLRGRVLVPFGTNLGPTWPPKPSQNQSNLVPKSIKKGIKMLTKFLRFIFHRSGDALLSIFPRSWKAEGPKSIEKNNSFVSIFSISDNWPTRSHMIDFLVNSVLNLVPKIQQKSTQEAPKIDKRGIENRM